MLQERSHALEKVEKEKVKKVEQMQQAQADLARQAAMIRDLQAHAKGKKEIKEAGASTAQVGTHILAGLLCSCSGADLATELRCQAQIRGKEKSKENRDQVEILCVKQV